MSPEIFRKEKYNSKGDVWALGCVLYELATGLHAFDGNSLNQLGRNIQNRLVLVLVASLYLDACCLLLDLFFNVLTTAQ